MTFNINKDIYFDKSINILPSFSQPIKTYQLYQNYQM